MDALAAYGSDSDVTSDEDVQPQASKKEQRSKFQGVDDSDSERKAPADASQKRRRLDVEGDQASSAEPTARLVPPQPTISSGVSMIQWNKDYLSRAQSFKSTPKHISSEKLEQIRSKLPANTSWASQLKSQHDFHNPNLFEGVVKLFDIQQPLGTNMKHKEGLQDWESDVVAMEEKARIHQQSQSQASSEPSEFAQQQLAQAMKQQWR